MKFVYICFRWPSFVLLIRFSRLVFSYVSSREGMTFSSGVFQVVLQYSQFFPLVFTYINYLLELLNFIHVLFGLCSTLQMIFMWILSLPTMLFQPLCHQHAKMKPLLRFLSVRQLKQSHSVSSDFELFVGTDGNSGSMFFEPIMCWAIEHTSFPVLFVPY